jgi:transposase-like protein
VLLLGIVLAWGTLERGPIVVADVGREGGDGHTLANGGPSIQLMGPDGTFRSIDEINAEAMRLALLHFNDVTAAAAALQIGRTTFYRRLAQGSLGSDLPARTSRSPRRAPRQEQILELVRQPCSAAELRAILKVSKQATHELLGRLLKEGSVTRYREPGRKEYLFRRTSECG